MRRRSGVVWLWNYEVLVSSSLSPLRHELQLVEAAVAGFEMAVLQKKISCFFPVKGSKGWEGSECLYSWRVLGLTRFPWASAQEKQAGNKVAQRWYPRR